MTQSQDATKWRTIIIEHQPQVIPETMRMQIGGRTYTMSEIAAIVARHLEDEEAAAVEAEASDFIDPPADIDIRTDINERVLVNGVAIPRLRFGHEDSPLAPWDKEYLILDDRVRLSRDAHAREWLWFLGQALTTQP